METLVVNLFGGPGIGKSTLAAGLFSELKQREINAELAAEYAKDRVWSRDYHTMDNQIYMFAKQHHRIWRLLGKVNVVVTDSPMLLSIHYGANYSKTFHDLVLEEYNKTNSLNLLLTREKKFVPMGRLQTEEESRQADSSIYKILNLNNISYTILTPGGATAALLAEQIIKHHLQE